jgi:hypothetical protein
MCIDENGKITLTDRDCIDMGLKEVNRKREVFE